MSANPFQTYYVVVDSKRGKLTRYVHHRGTWGVRHLRTVGVDNPAEFAELGTAEARTMIEQFRREGVAV